MALISTVWFWITDHATVISAVVSSMAAVAIARYTIRLTDATATQSRLTRDVLKLARDEFNATHRPELTIREVFWTTLQESRADVVTFTLINRGQSPARVVESALEVRGDNPAVSFATNGNNPLGEIQLAPGEFCSRSVLVDQFFAGARDLLEEAFFRGVIIYEDEARIRRRLIVCRRAPKRSERFLSLGDPEYEYTD